MMNIKKIYCSLLFLFVALFSSSICANTWQDSFHKYSKPKIIVAPNGFEVKINPSENSKTIKIEYKNSKLEVMGYFDNLRDDRLRFYMSAWSWKQYQKGKRPNWVLIKNGGQGGKYWNSTWRDSFVKLNSIEQVYADTHMVKKVPSLYAKDVKIITTSEYVNIAGYINSEEGRFYMSDWSWRRLSEGKDPNWVYIHKSNPTSSSEYYSNTAKFNYNDNDSEPEHTKNSRPSSSYSYPTTSYSSSYSPSDVYSSKRKRILKRSASALAQYASGKFIDNPVIAAAVGEAASALIEQRKFSPQEATSSAIVNAFSRKLKNKGHGNLGNVLDIGSTLQYIFSEN